MIQTISDQMASFTPGQWALAAIVAVLATLATFPSSRAGSLAPTAFALIATMALAFLWSDPSAVIEHARAAGAAAMLPATHQDLSLWLLALAAGTASWALASIAGLFAATYEGRT